MQMSEVKEPYVMRLPEEPELEVLQGIVGGYVEAMYTRKGELMFVNEEGRVLQLPHNVEASHLAGRDIVGNAVIIGESK